MEFKSLESARLSFYIMIYDKFYLSAQGVTMKLFHSMCDTPKV